MPECAKAHLQQSRITTVFQGSTSRPLSGEGEEKGETEKGIGGAEGERGGKGLEGGEEKRGGGTCSPKQ